MRRPALISAAALSCGILFGYYANPPILPLFISFVVLFLLCLLFTIFKRSGKLPISAIFLLMLALGGTLRYETKTRLLPPDHISKFPYFDREVILKVTIGGEPDERKWNTRVVMKVSDVEHSGVSYQVQGDVLLVLSTDADYIGYGDRIVLKGELNRPRPARNPGEFDYGKYLLRRGIFGAVYINDDDQILDISEGEGSFILSKIVYPLKRHIRESIERNLLGDPRALMKSLILGERGELSDKIKEAFIASGTGHILAISGLHVGIIAGFFLTIFSFFLPRRWASAIVILILCLYVLILDFRPSVLRASIMFSLIILAFALERNSESVNSLGVSALIILMVWPQSLFDAGFQLSFLSLLFILLFYGMMLNLRPEATSSHRWIEWIIGIFIVSIAAYLGTAPIVASNFNRVSLIFPIANLVIVPTAIGVIASGLVSVIFGPWLHLIATIFNAVGWLILKVMLSEAYFLSSFSFSSATVQSPSWFFFLSYYLILCIIAFGWKSVRARKIALFLILIVANVYVWKGTWEKERLEVVLLDVGQGDGIFIKFPNGKVMLMDGGPKKRSFGRSTIASFLRHRGVDKIDVVAVSHPHSDHIGGLLPVLRNFDVQHLLESGQVHDSKMWSQFEEILEIKGIKRHYASSGDSLAGLGIGALVLHPTLEFVSDYAQASSGLNNSSLVMRLTYKGKSLLLTGDVENATDKSLLRWKDRLSSTIVKAPHHGSSTSSSEDFIRSVNPRIAVVSVGQKNRFGHPSADVLERYESSGAKIYRTDKSGAVTIKIWENKVEVETMLD